jgi:homoserine kinase
VRDEVYELVAGIEGHGDNAAPAVYGGLMVVASNGPHRLVLDPSILPIVGIPHARLATRRARQVVPREVPMAAASRNVGRAVLLVEALRTGDPSAFGAAAGDEFHEEARGALSPITTAMIDAARSAGALHAAWSGAGPSTLALATAETQAVVIEALEMVLGSSGVVRPLLVDFDGLR